MNPVEIVLKNTPENGIHSFAIAWYVSHLLKSSKYTESSLTFPFSLDIARRANKMINDNYILTNDKYFSILDISNLY